MNTLINSMKLSEIQHLAEKYEIDTQHVSEKTGKMINKTKKMLIDNIHAYEQLQRQQENEIKRQKEEKQEEIHQTLINLLETNGEKFYDDETPSLFLVWTNRKVPEKEEDKKIFLEPSNLESKFNIKLTFGSFLRFKSNLGYSGSEFYIIGHDKKIIECNIMCQEESADDTEYIIIPREITKYLKDALSFFYFNNYEKYDKKVRSLPKHYSYEYTLNEDKSNLSSFQIGCVQLSSHDIYLHKHISNIELDSSILFDYRFSYLTDYEYKLFVFIPYLGKDNQIIEVDNYSSWIETYIDIYGKYGFLIKNDIDFKELKSLMIDYQTIKSEFTLKTKSNLNFNDEPPIGLSLETISSEKIEKDNSKFHNAIYIATAYEAFLARRNILQTWKNDISSWNVRILKANFSPLKEVYKKYQSFFFDDNEDFIQTNIFLMN